MLVCPVLFLGGVYFFFRVISQWSFSVCFPVSCFFSWCLFLSVAFLVSCFFWVSLSCLLLFLSVPFVSHPRAKFRTERSHANVAYLCNQIMADLSLCTVFQMNFNPLRESLKRKVSPNERFAVFHLRFVRAGGLGGAKRSRGSPHLLGTSEVRLRRVARDKGIATRNKCIATSNK